MERLFSSSSWIFLLASHMILSHFQTMEVHSADPKIIMVGSDIFPSSSTLDVPGVMFLSNDEISSSGILFAFSAFIVSNFTFSIQLWRETASPSSSPADNTFKAFQLIADIPFNSSTLRQRNDVYFKNISSRRQPCYKTLPGDRIGVSLPNNQWPIPYVFNPDNQQVYTLSFNASNPPKINDIIEIDQLIFPYKFSAAAWVVVTDDSNNASTSSEVSCPDLVIPSYTTTVATTTPTPARTGAPGATGATGPKGTPGAVGMPGPMGATGVTGAQGPTGAAGATGSAGGTGATGPPGLPGFLGSPGATGPSGAPGPKGAVGATGATGPQGPPGPSANTSSNQQEPSSQSSRDGPGADSSSIPWHRRQRMIIGVYVWLAIVSFLSLVVFIWTLVLCCMYCRLKTYRKRTDRDYGSYLDAYATK